MTNQTPTPPTNSSDGAKRPVVLCILDGWGWRNGGDDNAILHADTPNWDALVRDCPKTVLDASSGAVGLPDGQMGNSEVGHMTLGAGRVMHQDLVRIDRAVDDGSLAEISAFKTFVATLKQQGGVAHVLGLLSPGGVHAHEDHILALVSALSAAGVGVRLHAILDGRDTPPKSAAAPVAKAQAALAKLPDAQIATINGRYFAMDRDNRWDRIGRAFGAIALANSDVDTFDDAGTALQAAYGRAETDEFVSPACKAGYGGIAANDGILMANFRADRTRELLHALCDPAFVDLDRAGYVVPTATLGMVSYSSALDGLVPAMFAPETPGNVLGEVVSNAGLRQLRIAETEKYAHVTFFLNGGREAVFDGEERVLVPSPNVATYDLQPEMSAPEVTDRLVDAIRGGTFDMIVVNYANGDMVGHTGNFDAAKKACETLDGCLGRVQSAVLDAGGALLVTADHGNCEQMFDATTNGAHTAHTLNLVPFIVAGCDGAVMADGTPCGLADVAPTVLALMGLAQPKDMTGRSLVTLGPNASRTAAAE